jgi:phosphoribosylanthranilate isomerase
VTWVKVCGLATAEDVAVAQRAGADAVGFVNVSSSPRFIPLHKAVDLAEGTSVATVLLTMDEEPERVLEILETTAITGIQPYGRKRLEAATAAEAAGHLVLYATRAAPGLDLGSIPGVPLLDTPSIAELGGTGRTFDWALTEGLGRDFVLAGGLGPANIVDAITRVQPWGVDASSGLEKAAGVKDRGMVADFIEKAKST